MFCAKSAGVRVSFQDHLHEWVSCMANTIRIRLMLFRMKSKGGEEAVANPLDLLCLTDPIVLSLFLVAENSPLCCCTQSSAGGE